MAKPASNFRLFKILLFSLCVPFFKITKLSSASYGSDTAVSIVNPFNITGGDNIIRTFGAPINGFAFVDNTVGCSFNSVYEVAGPISLRGGRLYLQKDLLLTNTGTFADLGTIIGQNHAVDLSQSSNTFASVTNPTGARVLSLIARTVPARTIYSLDWSYDNKYVAAVLTSGSGNDLLIYSFDGTTLTLKTGVNLSGSGTSVRWRPNSYYLAAASDYTSGKIRIYLYNPTINTLTLKNTQNPTGTFYAVAWQGRGNYLAAGGTVIQVYHFNNVSETLDVNYTPTNNAALNGNVTYDCIHWAPVGNKNDFIAGTLGGSLHLYNFTGSAVNHLKRYEQGTEIDSLDWAPTSTYMVVGFSSGPIKAYQHTASINNITYKNGSASIPANAYSISWKPNATELAAGLYGYAGAEHQNFSFNTSTYALTNVYNIKVNSSVFCIRYSNITGAYIARSDATTHYLSIYKESYSPFIFKDVNLFLNSNLTIGTPITFQGNCTINGRGNSMTFTGDGSINVATNSKLSLSNSTLFFKRPNAFAMQGRTSQIVFDDIDIGLASNIVFGDGSWETYNDVNITGPYTFAYETANTSTIHADSYLKFGNSATFAIGKTKAIGPSILEFESNASHLVFDNAALNITNSGLRITKGIVDVYGNTNFIIDNDGLDSNSINTAQSLVFGDGTNAGNDPLLILHGNGTNLTIVEGAVIFDTKATTSMVQFQGQSQLSFDTTASTYFKRSLEFTDGWIRPATSTSFYIEPGQFLTVNNVRFDYRDLFADYNVTGTLINPTHTLLGASDYIFVNRGNSV
jgi:hypothetical protein